MHGKRPTPTQPAPLDTPARPHLASALSHVQFFKKHVSLIRIFYAHHIAPPLSPLSSTPTHPSGSASLTHPPGAPAAPGEPRRQRALPRSGTLDLHVGRSRRHPILVPHRTPSLPFPPSTHRASASMKSSAASQAVGIAFAWSGEAASSLASGGSVVWTSLGPLPRWVPGPTTR
jgi:hypothetical protein